jgi:adenylate kinase
MSMSMNQFRRLAAKLDQHMQQLSAQGVNDAHAIINHLMGYVPTCTEFGSEHPTPS